MLGQQIRRLRESYGMNQSQFAKRLFVTQGAVSQWENGRTTPTIDQLISITRTFNVPISQILEIKEGPQHQPQAQVDELTELCSQLTPANQEKAASYLRYLLEREQSDRQAPQPAHQD